MVADQDFFPDPAPIAVISALCRTAALDFGLSRVLLAFSAGDQLRTTRLAARPKWRAHSSALTGQITQYDNQKKYFEKQRLL